MADKRRIQPDRSGRRRRPKKRLIPHSINSQGSKQLARGLGVIRVIRDGNWEVYKPRPYDTIINWGCSDLPLDAQIINHPDLVKIYHDKLETFKALSKLELPVPGWTQCKAYVHNCMVNEGTSWLARKLLTSSSGRGIIKVEDPNDIPDAPLYVKYVPKKEEYRVHWCKWKGSFITQRKAKAQDREVKDWQIRNHDNGFVFVQDRDLGPVPGCVSFAAQATMEQTGLDFGAVDVIYNQKHDQAYVLEINTAPGLVGRTLEAYIDAFKERL